MNADIAIENIRKKLIHKQILILGFGREGQSTFDFLKKHKIPCLITVADQHLTEESIKMLENESIPFINGDNYLHFLNDFDIVFKSPGISLKNHIQNIDKERITSQTDVFLSLFAAQCIAVTGTKGKSTTTSLIYHIINKLYPNSIMAGNIGIPLFNIIDKVNDETKIVLELSSHQLEFIHKSPHISVLLNLFEEHLDHYRSFEDYQSAKYNIARFQSENDFFIYHSADILVQKWLKEEPPHSNCIGFALDENENTQFFVKNDWFYQKSKKIIQICKKFPLKGTHNLQNTCATLAVLSCIQNIDIQTIAEKIYTFKGLAHRLELVGVYDDITFYNDSISTIAQSTIAAVKALKDVNTLILGGFDRGIDYRPLADFCKNSSVENFIFTGNAGKRMMNVFEMQPFQKMFYCANYQLIIYISKLCTPQGGTCLLSPAAASYDQFKDFAQRGEQFKELVKQKKDKT